MRSPWRRSLPTGPGPPAKALVHIVEEQRKALAQHDALVLEDEIAKTRSRYTALLGAEEWPDNQQQEE